ncbi:MAG TPA: DNA polymerase IV [Polyangiales bacterium]|nr:DNA polymerase IV [Polyangiales bacterium]
MTAEAPRICCLDLDTFFVSVERLLDPSLLGKPVIVGGQPGTRGVVTACSYEVRALGVRSGMSLTEAAKLAPHAIYLSGRDREYGKYSEQVVAIAQRYSPLVRMASIDELYMDFRGCERLFQRPGDHDADATILRVVHALTDCIAAEVGLPASAGIATSKSVAKIACGLAKPRGVLLVRAGQEAHTLAPLPVRKLPGIGPVTEQRIVALGITTLGELATSPVRVLERAFGPHAASMRARALGHGDAELSRDRPAFHEHDMEGESLGSISNERTFHEDVRELRVVESMLCALCERVCWRARRRGVEARTITLKLRYADFDTITRSRTVTPSASERELLPLLKRLYRDARQRSLAIRLLGVALSNLVLAEQLPLFPRDGQVRANVDELRERYGFDAVRLGTGLRVPRDDDEEGDPAG